MLHRLKRVVNREVRLCVACGIVSGLLVALSTCLIASVVIGIVANRLAVGLIVGVSSGLISGAIISNIEEPGGASLFTACLVAILVSGLYVGFVLSSYGEWFYLSAGLIAGLIVGLSICLVKAVEHMSKKIRVYVAKHALQRNFRARVLKY